MSDKHLQTRKTLTLSSGVYGISTVAGLILGITKWMAGGLTGFGLVGILALLILSFSYFRGAWKSFSDMEYGKSNTNSFLASLSSIGATILAFML